ncbi:MAG: phosphate ABC transporter permease subunit PstC [Vulcanimicrobiaceae bacterium]
MTSIERGRRSGVSPEDPLVKGLARAWGLQRPWAQLIFKLGTGTTAVLSALVVVLICVFLTVFAWPAIRFNGWNILTGTIWNIGNQYGSGSITHNGYSAEPGAQFGGLVFIFGTLATATVAMIAAVPLAFLVSVALVYRVPARIRPLANALVELMAGVPSVVYGLWGMVVLVPWIGTKLAPAATAHLGFLPIFHGDAGSGNGLLAASTIIALMVIPIMVATIRDVINAQATSVYEASMALGSTSWQAVTRAVLPSVRNGMIAAIMVAFGRALGETMAVLMVCGAAINTYPQNIFQSVNTLAAVIVSQLESALTDSSGMAQRSLAELAVVLFAITVVLNMLARGILRGADRSQEVQ